MRLIMVNLMGGKHIIACKSCDDGLRFYCHNEDKSLSYYDKVSDAQLLERSQKLNKRINFPANVIRDALLAAEPIHAEAEEEVLKLKYSVENTRLPLKWEWVLTPIENAVFYRTAFIDVLTTAAALNEHVKSLVNVVEKKDIEIKQYKIEGTELRRNTVATNPFDVEHFNTQNKSVLQDGSCYKQMTCLFSDSPEKNLSDQPQDANNSPSTIDRFQKTVPISPRQRKRKILETGISRMDRKIKPPMSPRQIQYNDSQSQSENVDEAFEEVMKTNETHTSLNSNDSSAASLHLQFSDDEEKTEPVKKLTKQTTAS